MSSILRGSVEVAVQPLKENDKQLRRSGSKAHVVYLHR
jgi:hypothetical protein